MMTTFIQRHFLGIVLLTVTFSLPLTGLGFAFPLQTEDVLLLPMAVAFVLVRRDQRLALGAIMRRKVLFAYLVLTLAGVCGVSIGVFGFNQSMIPRDFMFIPQVVKYCLIYLAPQWLMTTWQAERNMMRYLWFSAALCSLLGLAQFWNIFSVNSWLAAISSGLDTDSSELLLRETTEGDSDIRVCGITGNPNYYGYVLMWHAMWLVTSMLYAQEMRARFICAVILVPVVLGVILSQSRSSYISLAVLLVLLSILKTHKPRSNQILALAVILSMMVTIWFLFFAPMVSEGAFGARLALQSDSTQSSADARIRDLVVPLTAVLDDPLLFPFGRGPNKADQRTDSHNGYTWFLQRFGFIGLFGYAYLLGMLLRQAYRLHSLSGDWCSRHVGLACFLCFSLWFLAEWAGNVFKDPQLMALNMLAAGWLSAKISQESPLQPFHQDTRLLVRCSMTNNG